MARKKKQTRKYMPRNEFRYNKSNKVKGHPHYIFGETRNGKYKSLGLTSTPKAGHPYIPLHRNPEFAHRDSEPDNASSSYLQTEVQTFSKSYYSKKALSDWHFAKEDMPVVRHVVKDYKKRTNRKPKGWYAKKRKWNKKKK